MHLKVISGQVYTDTALREEAGDWPAPLASRGQSQGEQPWLLGIWALGSSETWPPQLSLQRCSPGISATAAQGHQVNHHNHALFSIPKTINVRETAISTHRGGFHNRLMMVLQTTQNKRSALFRISLNYSSRSS